MKTFDALTRTLTLLRRQPHRWLREELSSRGITVPLCDSCVLELVRHADEMACAAMQTDGRAYLEALRAQLASQAHFVQRWTTSDDKLTVEEAASLQSLVRIAHKYALPRPWKLSEPVAIEYQRQQPSFWDWASASEVAQS